MIALDTHALVWWAAGDSQLSRSAREAIEAEVQDGEILVSAISAWEVAMLAKAGRLALTMDAGPGWIRLPRCLQFGLFQWMYAFRSNPSICLESFTRTRLTASLLPQRGTMRRLWLLLT